MYQSDLTLYVFDMTLICFDFPLYMYSCFEYDLTCHTCRRYELQPVKDMTQGSNTNKIMIWNLKRIKSTCII